MTTREFLYVEWVDSTGRDGWQAMDAADPEVAQCVSLGFLHSETKLAITLVQTYAKNGQWAANGTIPKVAITKRKKVPLPKALKK